MKECTNGNIKIIILQAFVPRYIANRCIDMDIEIMTDNMFDINTGYSLCVRYVWPKVTFGHSLHICTYD